MRPKPLSISCLWLLLLCSFCASAQLPDYYIRLFDESYGIRTVGLRRMTKDQQGFVWLMYHNQVKRFDGKRISTFIPGERLMAIHCDRRNRIWVAGVNGLYRFGNDRTGFLPVNVDTAGQPKLGPVFQLPGQPVSLLTSLGLYTYDSLREKFMPASPFHGTRPFNVRQYALSASGHTFFYCSAGQVYRLNTASGRCDSLPVSDLFSVNALNDHETLVSDWKNQSFVYDFDGRKIRPVNIRQYLPQAADDFFVIYDALHLGHHRHILATSKGVLEYNSATGKLFPRKLFYKGQPLPNQEGLVDLYLDGQQQVWGCSDYSLLSFNPARQGIGLIRNWETDPAKLFSNHVRGFAADEKENLWLATINGIAYFDLQQGTIRPIFPTARATDRMNHPSIRGIAYDGRFVIIGQTNRGIWLYDPATGRYQRPSFPHDSLRRQLENDFVDQLYTLQNGHHVVVARDRGYLLNGKNYRVTVLRFPGERENLNFCYQDRQRQVWIGTGRGLYCLNAALQPVRTIRDRVPGVPRCMYQLTDSTYILGTKGLYLLAVNNRGTAVRKLTPYFDGLTIHSIFRDRENRLWLATDDGLYRYSLHTGKAEYFDQYDNIQGNHFYQNSMYYSRNGTLFLGGFNGINYFNPETVKAADDSLQVTLTGIRINNDDSGYLASRGTAQLRYFQNSVHVDFVAPYFSNTARVQYRYRLQGLDDRWVPNGSDNSVHFSSLPPGPYTFTVAASLGNGKWFETARPFSFIIQPPFWNTWWFLLLGVAAAALLLFLLVRRMQEKVRAEKVLNYFATSLYGQNTTDDIFWDVARNCIAQLRFEDCVIYEYDNVRGLLVQKAAYGPKNPVKREIFNPLEIPPGKGIVGAVALTGKAEIVSNTRKDARYIIDDKQRLSEIAVPIMVDGKLFGIIDSEHPRKSFYTRRHLRLLTKIAGICASKISTCLVEEKLRSKIARDLHDEIGSTLTSINIISKMAMQQIPQHEAMQLHLQRIKEHSTHMMESMSDIVWAINPANDAFERIIIRLKEFTAEMLEPARINYRFNEDGQLHEVKLNAEQRKDLYLIYKEAINNAVKYSNASEVEVVMRREHGAVSIRIADNGKGFDIKKACSGNGIRNMHNRAAELKGRLQIDAAPGAGTTVLLQLPV